MIGLNKKQEEFLYRLIEMEKDTNRFNNYIIDLVDSKNPYLEYTMLIELGKLGMIEYAQYGEDLIIGDITSVGLSYKDCKKEKEMQVKREHSLKIKCTIIGAILGSATTFILTNIVPISSFILSLFQ